MLGSGPSRFSVRNRSRRGRSGRIAPTAEPYALGEEPLALLPRLACTSESVRGTRSAVVPEPARAAARFGGGTEPDDRVGALRRRPQQGSCHPVEARQRGSHAGSVRPPRVHRVNHDPGARQLLCPELGKDHLPALGARVHLRSVKVPALALQVINPEPLRVHATRGDVDDPRRGAFPEHREE